MRETHMTTVTYPLDITKTRLQLDKGPKSVGMLAKAFGIARNEGVTALYRGLPASFLRHAVYSGSRVPIYRHLREITGGRDSSVLLKALSGAFAGGVSQFVASKLLCTWRVSCALC
jgi:hypothetical protein